MLKFDSKKSHTRAYTSYYSNWKLSIKFMHSLSNIVSQTQRKSTRRTKFDLHYLLLVNPRVLYKILNTSNTHSMLFTKMCLRDSILPFIIVILVVYEIKLILKCPKLLKQAIQLMHFFLCWHKQ